MVIPYLGTLIAKIYSNFTGEADKLVVVALIFHPVLLPDDETPLKAYGNFKL